MKGHLYATAVMVGSLLLFGCSANQLGNARYGGPGKDLLQKDSTVEVTSQADKLKVKIVITQANVCEGEFAMVGQGDAYPPIMMDATIDYAGKWNANQSAECQDQIGGPGGMAERRVQVRNAKLFGYDRFIVCTAGSDKLCMPKNTFRMDMMK